MFSSEGTASLLSIPFPLVLRLFSSISVLPAAIMALRTLPLSPIRSLILSFPRFCPAVWYRESFGTKRKHFDFQRDGGGQRKLVDHADVDNHATVANLHTSILTNFSSTRRRFRLPSPSFASASSLHSNGFMWKRDIDDPGFFWAGLSLGSR